MVMFGGPVHSPQSQIQSARRELDVELSQLYLPDVALISFNDSLTGTSHIKLIRHGSALDIGKLTDVFYLHWKVVTSLSPHPMKQSLRSRDRSQPIRAYIRWKRFYSGLSFSLPPHTDQKKDDVQIAGILFQLPSGLGTGGQLVCATETAEGSTTSSIDGFSVALRLISVEIGLAVGLCLPSAVAFPIQSKKREGGIFSL